MKKFISIIIICVLYQISFAQTNQTTICNPLNLSYRFCLDEPSRREAADPVMIVFKNEYYLFASKSGGYWHSTDLISWDFITSTNLPFEDYAPGVVVINETLYFMAGGKSPVKIYKTTDPKTGIWEIATANFPLDVVDPDFFLDDNGRLYYYYGCSNTEPIYAIELDTKTFNPIGTPTICFNNKKEDYGWERQGNYNDLPENPWIEGAWMTKYNGTYYLQYAGPGTELKSYCDGVYTSKNPLGPFTIAPLNPCSYKPEGFAAGAGHGSTFQDIYGNYWHIATMTISQKHIFERRLGLFPMFFDSDGELYAYTGFGDFPFTIPQKKIQSPDELFPQWMLLSYNKPITVSSEIAEHPKNLASDENIRTYWSAQTGNKGEFISIDLEKESTIKAIQINFAENKTNLYGRNPNIYYQYLVEYSNDNKTWTQLVDKTTNKTDFPHDYIQLEKSVHARYIRITNYYFPDGTFAISDIRISGNQQGKAPQIENIFTVTRSQTDKREVTISWNSNPNAVGYNIRYGTQANKLYLNYQVLQGNSITIRSLNRLKKYYFTIDVFNENGVTKGTKIISVE